MWIALPADSFTVTSLDDPQSGVGEGSQCHPLQYNPIFPDLVPLSANYHIDPKTKPKIWYAITLIFWTNLSTIKISNSQL